MVASAEPSLEKYVLQLHSHLTSLGLTAGIQSTLPMSDLVRHQPGTPVRLDVTHLNILNCLNWL